MTTVSPGLSPAELQKAARDHLWLHFTQMGGYLDSEVPIIVRGEGCYLEDANGKRYLDALAGLFAVQIGYSYGDEVGEAARGPDAGAALLHELVVRAPARDRARGRGGLACARRPEPRLLRLRRLRGDRVGVEARAAVLLGPGRAPHRAGADPGRPGRAPRTCRLRRRAGGEAHRRAPVEGDLTPRRLPRHDDGRAVDQRDPRDPEPVRATRPRRAPRAEHQPLPPPDGGDRGAVHALPARRARADDRGNGPGDGRDGDHGAGPERRRGVHAARGLLARAYARSAIATRSCSARTR